MKKTLIAIAAAAAVTTSAFAEITFGAWGRGVLAPIASNGDGTQAFYSTSWGGQPRIGFEINGVSDNVGFRVTMNADSGEKVEIHDEAKIWVKPADFIKVTAGKIQNNTLYGNWCYGSWNWLRPSFIDDEGITFGRFEDKGMQIELFPVEGLYLAVGVPLKNNGWGTGDWAYTAETAENKPNEGKYVQDVGEAYRASVVHAAYTIAGVGKIKAGYYGSNKVYDYTDPKTKKTSSEYQKGKIEAAFESRGDNALVDGLGFEVGVAYNLTDKDYLDVTNLKDDTKIALGVSYNGIENVGFTASGAVFIPKNTDKQKEGTSEEYENKLWVRAGAGVDYTIADAGITINADVRLQTARTSTGDTSIGFLVGAAKGFSNGKIGIGFQAATKGGFVGGLKGRGEVAGVKGKDDDKLTWCVPVTLEYWF